MDSDYLLKFAYKMAFNDATMRRAFEKNEDNDKTFTERKRRAFDISKPIVKDYIDNIFLDNRSCKPLDVIVHVAYINDNQHTGFSFGNSQKLVNMTAKYMFLSTYGDSAGHLRKKFEACHCPMDGIMLGRLSEMGIKFGTNISWSKLKLDNNNAPKEYTWYQNSINELCSNVYKNYIPLELDYLLFDE